MGLEQWYDSRVTVYVEGVVIHTDCLLTLPARSKKEIGSTTASSFASAANLASTGLTLASTLAGAAKSNKSYAIRTVTHTHAHSRICDNHPTQRQPTRKQTTHLSLILAKVQPCKQLLQQNDLCAPRSSLTHHTLCAVQVGSCISHTSELCSSHTHPPCRWRRTHSTTNCCCHVHGGSWGCCCCDAIF